MEERTKSARRPLSFSDSLRLKSAENWLSLGIVEEAVREVRSLRRRAISHPEALRVFRALQCCSFRR